MSENDGTTEARDEGAAERIRERAYHLWRSAGCPQGRDEEFWIQASNEEAALQNSVDQASEDSFPASDPPASSGITGPRVDKRRTGSNNN